MRSIPRSRIPPGSSCTGRSRRASAPRRRRRRRRPPDRWAFARLRTARKPVAKAGFSDAGPPRNPPGTGPSTKQDAMRLPRRRLSGRPSPAGRPPASGPGLRRRGPGRTWTGWNRANRRGPPGRAATLARCAGRFPPENPQNGTLPAPGRPPRTAPAATLRAAGFRWSAAGGGRLREGLYTPRRLREGRLDGGRIEALAWRTERNEGTVYAHSVK